MKCKMFSIVCMFFQEEVREMESRTERGRREEAGLVMECFDSMKN